MNIWIVTVVYAGELELTEAYKTEEDAYARERKLSEDYHSVSVEEVPVL